jgi:ABC-type amino acid transport substrate-binding protein
MCTTDLGFWDIVGESKTATVGREMKYGIEFPYPWFFDGGSMLYRVNTTINDDFASANVGNLKYCVLLDSTTYDIGRVLFSSALPVFVESTGSLANDVYSGLCDFGISDRASLAQQLITLPPEVSATLRVSAHVFSREPVFGAVKRGGTFSKIVKWVSMGMQLASKVRLVAN